MALPDILRKEHAALLDVLKAVETAGINTAAGRGKLFDAKNLLVAHLQKEDRELYPLLDAAQGESQRTGRQFGAEMKKMSDGVLGFFAKYADGGSGLEFARDYGQLVGALRARIRNEELILYPAFEKLSVRPH